MKHPCANFTRATLLLGVLASFAVLPAAALAQDSNANPTNQTQQSTSEVHGRMKSVIGTICKGTDGDFLLRDESNSGLYWLDDQRLARKFAGKSVVVTGVLDAANNLIRILKIHSSD